MPTIPALHVGQGLPVGPVTLFPVWSDVRPIQHLRTGSAAHLDVGELAAAAQINRLSVYNPGDDVVLLLEGELLEGGLQTRACVHDLLIPPHQHVDIDVACVEPGRWSGDSRHERRSRRATTSVRRALRNQAPSRQSAVWSDVARYESAGAPTESSSLGDHLTRTVSLPTPRPLAGQNGVIVGVSGHPVALELFGSRSGLAAHLPGIVAAAQLEAALSAAPIPVPARRARRFASAVESIAWQSLSHPGQGSAWSGRSEHVSLRALTAGSGLAHLAAVTA